MARRHVKFFGRVGRAAVPGAIEMAHTLASQTPKVNPDAKGSIGMDSKVNPYAESDG